MADLGLPGPAVAEGGAVILSEDGSESVTGPCRADLVAVLHELQNRGWKVRGMSEMSVGEVMAATGLGEEGARRAMTRSASEPFVLTGESAPSVEEIFELGASLARGGRFRHLLGKGIDKGAGVRAMLAVISHELPAAAGHLRTAAIGDAWNDLPMLEEVEIGFLLGNAVETDAVPSGILRIEYSGPQGFTDAIGRILAMWNVTIPG